MPSKKGKKKDKVKDIKDPLVLKEKGVKAFQEGNFQEALQNFSSALELSPENAIIYNNRSAVYAKMEKFEEALADASKAVELDPTYVKGYYRQALALLELDRIEEALKTLDPLVKETEEQFIKELYDKIQQEWKEENLLDKENPERKKYEEFMKWLSDNECKLDKLKIRWYSADYRGVHARQAIKRNEIFLYIPKRMIITLEMAKATPIGAKMVKADLKLISPKHSYLSSFILQERRKDSTPWEMYLEILPKNFDSFPIFFTPEEKEWLKGSPFLKQVEEKIEDIKTDYDTICAAVPEYANFPIKEFSEIRMMVSSRIFGMSIDGVKTDGFVPMADMLNHRRPRQTSWAYQDEKQGFIIEALEDIPRGEGVYDSYGKKCNSRFFQNYGFIVENNDGNEVPLKVYFHKDDPLLQLKKELVSIETDFKSYRVSTDFAEPNINNFLSYLRFVEYQGNPITIINYHTKAKNKYGGNDSDNDEREIYKGHNIPPLSIENEKRVLIHMKLLCQKQLAQYPTTYEEDIKILDTEKDLTFNERNSVLMRSGEKEILIFLSKMADLSLAMLGLTPKKAREYYKKSKGEEFDKYISGCILPLIKQSVTN